MSIVLEKMYDHVSLLHSKHSLADKENYVNIWIKKNYREKEDILRITAQFLELYLRHGCWLN